MTHEEQLRKAFVTLEVNGAFSEAVAKLRDGSRLCFCHKVGERWAKAVGPPEAETEGLLAGEILPLIAQFRLNAKHLDIHFVDGSRWEMRFSRKEKRTTDDTDGTDKKEQSGARS